MARHAVIRRDLLAQRYLLRAAWHGVRTARMEATARWRCKRTGDLSGDGQPFLLVIGMRRQCSDQQRLRVGMKRMRAKLGASASSTSWQRYITAMRWLIYATPARSWPINR